MRKILISFWNTNLLRFGAVALIALVGACQSALYAQGINIPASSEVNAQRQLEMLLEEELPEGVKYRYPLLNGMSVSANLFPIALNLFGKKYGTYEGALTFDIHHRFFPQASAGVGFCNETSKNVGTTNANSDTFQGLNYHCKTFPFFKAGMLYNFKYNEVKPNDFYGALLRFGYAYSKADIKNMSYNDGYWESMEDISAHDMEFHSVWLEVGGFIKVQVIQHISLGWDLSWKPFLHKGKVRNGSPYFVPGYGVTTNPIGFGFHLYYDL